jgi:hypothetical protein
MFGRMNDPVDGTALVVAVEDVLPTANPIPFRGKLVVSAEKGLPKTTVEHKDRDWRSGGLSLGAAVTSFWPTVGSTIPVQVDRADPTRLKIQWKQLIDGKSASDSAAKKGQEEELIDQAYREPGSQ